MGFPAEDLFLICENCRGDRVYIDTNTGEYYCEDCGIQQQEIRELERDIDDIYLEISNGPDGRRSNIRRASQSTEKLKDQKDSDENSKDDLLCAQNSNNTYNKKQTHFDKWINKKPKTVKNSDFLIGVQLIIQHTIKDMIERRQINISVLKASKSIWFLFMEYLSKNDIPIRAFFVDLRCSVLKVPFDETNSSSSNININNSKSIKTPKICEVVGQEKTILYDLIYNSFGIDRIEYLSKICKGIIRHSNSTNIRKKNGNNTKFNGNINECLLEEWEISARKLQYLANERNIPYFKWYGESYIPRTDLIKYVIDMIYEHDFLECYFNSISKNMLENKYLNYSRFNEWIYFHVDFYIKNRKINQDYISISKYLDSPEIETQHRKDIEFQLQKVYVIHVLLYKTLDKYLRRVFNNSSLSDYSSIHGIYKDVEFRRSRKRLPEENFIDRISECPKIDYSFILCIIWISMLKSGYQVTSYDIIEWVKTGKIDIFKSENFIPKWLRDAGFKWDNDINSNINTRSVTQISRIPSPADLEKVIIFFSKSIKVVIPPVNVPIIIHRILVNCKLLGYRGGVSIQPLCIRLWEFLLKEGNIPKLFSKLTIAPSIIMVIARSVWPIFVYHCIPNSKRELENKQINRELLNFNIFKRNEPLFKFNIGFNSEISSWILKTNKIPSLSEEIRFCSVLHGIEWSGILAINWLFTYLIPTTPVSSIEVNNTLESLSERDSEFISERKGRPTANFRGNFFVPIRKRRQGIKKKIGRNNWSGIIPEWSKNLYYLEEKKIIVFSRYLPSNREVFHSMLFKTINKANVLSSFGAIQAWGFIDDIEKEELILNWEKVLLAYKETENSTILKGIIKDISPSAICSLLPLIMDCNFLKSEGKCFKKIESIIDHIFNLKLNSLRNLFQDPGIFTSVVLPLPQFIHSKQKFTNSETSIPTPYSTLLLQLTEITGENYLNVHNCVIKIEEILAEKLGKR